MADVTKSDIETLVELTREREAITQRIAPDVLRMKETAKRIDAIVSTASAAMIASGKTERTRFGVVFRIVEKSGTVAWRKLCESVKGKEWCQMQAADVPRVQSCEYRLPG